MWKVCSWSINVWIQKSMFIEEETIKGVGIHKFFYGGDENWRRWGCNLWGNNIKIHRWLMVVTIFEKKIKMHRR